MKKVTGMLMAVVTVLILAGAAYAWWDGPGCGNGPGCGYGPGCGSGTANVETMKKFHKETFGLRDELMTKRIELRGEYDRSEPDRARIASIQKDMIDLRTKIQVIADKYGIAGCGPGQRGKGKGRMGRGRMMADCPCPGPGQQ